MKKTVSSSEGFILLEFLIAAFLFSLAGVVLYTGLTQGLRASKQMREKDRASTPLRLFSLELDKALRNAVMLKDYPFQGKRDDISFPGIKSLETKDGLERKIFLTRYFLENKKIMRSEKEIKTGLAQARGIEKVMASGIESLRFSFSYRQSDETLSFEPVWEEGPSKGIPRAVKVEMTTDKITMEKIVSIPHGKFGHLKEGRGVA